MDPPRATTPTAGCTVTRGEYITSLDNLLSPEHGWDLEAKRRSVKVGIQKIDIQKIGGRSSLPPQVLRFAR
jgi:hypothetical protein